MGTGFLHEMMRIFWNWMIGMVAQLYKCTRKWRIALFRRVNFMVCELHLNKKFLIKKKKTR